MLMISTPKSELSCQPPSLIFSSKNKKGIYNFDTMQKVKLVDSSGFKGISPILVTRIFVFGLCCYRQFNNEFSSFILFCVHFYFTAMRFNNIIA